MTATTNSLPTVANTPSPLGASDWNKFRKFVEFIELINWGYRVDVSKVTIENLDNFLLSIQKQV